MDQEQASEALSTSTSSTKKLNAKAPEFVPRSPAALPPPQPVLHHVYARTPSFVPQFPPAYYGYENYYQPNALPFYGYKSNPVSPGELAADRNNGGASAATSKNGLSAAYHKVLNQVEFYFSDINLATTDQLFRIMSKDPEGYVPLSVVASFKKIKTAINDTTQLASVLQSSRYLLVSEDGEKVKRQHPLTESDMAELQSRIVVAENLPEDHCHQNLMKIFSSVGSVKSIRTCPPQNSNNGTSSASKTGKGDVMHFCGKFHAFVEYESVKLAEKAVVELTDEGNWRNGLKVRFLLKNAVKLTQGRAKKVGNEDHPMSRKDETSTPEMQCFKENHLEDSQPHSDSQLLEHQESEDNGSSNARRKGHNHASGKGKGKGKGKGQGSGRLQPPISEGNMMGYPSTEVSMSIEKQTTGKTSPVPRMPDGTKGFSMGRGKPVPVKIV